MYCKYQRLVFCRRGVLHADRNHRMQTDQLLYASWLRPPRHNDIASYIGQTRPLSPATKYDLLQNHFSPGADYRFPKSTNGGRTFQYQWLVRYPWLRYSQQANGGFCLPCCLFANSAYQGSSPGILVSRPLTRFATALASFRNHAQKDYHKESVVKAEEFLKVATSQQPSIQQQLNQTIADNVSLNRKKLESIFKTVAFCGRQNIALRGHRDSITDLEKDQLEAINHGNFWALLNFRVDAGDVVLEEHLAHSARNATYTSPSIQNQLISVLADQIRHKIITRVKSAKWYSVLADEVTDASNKEQLTIVLRYVDGESQLIREDFVGFFECDSGITGRSLADKITSSLKSFGLDLQFLRGQGYDGAGNMAGS